MKTKIFLRCLSVFLVLSLTACSKIPDIFESLRTSFLVYFDPRYSFQIIAVDHVKPFPFESGELVEVQGSLVYHEVSVWIRSEVFPQAEWSASVIPHGEVQSLDSLRVRLRGVATGDSYEVDWVIDNDDILLVVSDSPLPEALFVDPRPGDSKVVCITLEIDDVVQEEDGSVRHLMVTLKPSGEERGGLVQSEVRICESQ
jgi:hypothetical protein